jgi:CheY-like chemotaxis protein
VLSTGYNSKVDSAKAAALGIHQFLNKPVRKREIAQAICQAFEKPL